MTDIFSFTASNKYSVINVSVTFNCIFRHPTTNGARAVEETVFDFATSLNDELRMKHEESATGWYTLNGLRLDREPTAKGIYIHNGRVVVIK